ncbi:hypothetical protein MHK_009488, partial [Candidatus Magnetomorum sp. HK-1]
MNILKQEGVAILEFLSVVTVILTLGVFANSNYEVKSKTPEEIIKIKPVIRYIEKNPVNHALDVTPVLENSYVPVYKKKPVHHNRFQTPKKFKSSQTVIQKVNRNAHIKPFIANKDNLLGYKGACMKYPFSS